MYLGKHDMQINWLIPGLKHTQKSQKEPSYKHINSNDMAL